MSRCCRRAEKDLRRLTSGTTPRELPNLTSRKPAESEPELLHPNLGNIESHKENAKQFAIKVHCGNNEIYISLIASMGARGNSSMTGTAPHEGQGGNAVTPPSLGEGCNATKSSAAHIPQPVFAVIRRTSLTR